jgi:hypothetical protein
MVAERLADPSRAQLIRDLVRIATVDRQRRTGRMSLADGRHFDFAVVPLPDGNALFTLLDITASRGIEEALRERAEALEEADRLKTAFVANMSYELQGAAHLDRRLRRDARRRLCRRAARGCR